MVISIKKLIIESEILELVKNELQEKLNNFKQYSQKFNIYQQQVNKQIEAKDPNLLPDQYDKNLDNQSIPDSLQESLIETKKRYIEDGDVTQDGSKLGNNSKALMNTQGQNADQAGISANQVAKHTQRHLETGKIGKPLEESSKFRKDFRSGPDSPLNIGNVTTKEAIPIETHYDRVIKRLDGTYPELPEGIKRNRSEIGLDNRFGRLSRSLRITDKFKKLNKDKL